MKRFAYQLGGGLALAAAWSLAGAVGASASSDRAMSTGNQWDGSQQSSQTVAYQQDGNNYASLNRQSSQYANYQMNGSGYGRGAGFSQNWSTWMAMHRWNSQQDWNSNQDSSWRGDGDNDRDDAQTSSWSSSSGGNHCN